MQDQLSESTVNRFLTTLNYPVIITVLSVILLLTPTHVQGESGRVISVGSDRIPHVSIHQLELSEQYPDLLPAGGIAPQRLRPVSRNVDISVVGFMPYWMGDAWLDLPLNLLSQVAWFSLELAPDGSITVSHGWPDGPMVDHLHGGGVDVLLTTSLFGSADLRTLLSTPQYSEAARTNLLNQMRLGDADGLMIDFELLPGDQYWPFINFMQLLRTDLDQLEVEDDRTYRLAAATPAVDWNGSYGYSALSDVCDYLFVMAYDYYWSGSSTTGPVSPATGWGTYNVNWTIDDYLYYNGNRPEKLVLGLPWYGYDWSTVSDEPGAATTGSCYARTWAGAHQHAQSEGFERDVTTATPWTPWIDTGSWRQCWYEDTLSLGVKLDLMEQNDLQGVGFWALGYNGDYPEVWQQLDQRYGQLTTPRVSILRDGDHVLVHWNEVPGATVYKVYQSEHPLFQPVENDLVLVTDQLSMWSAVNSNRRFFRIVACR